ncbi:MAG: hypothetical protein H0V66_07435 [Bdellovibrionales bacterium]|nr:hypothetical protein [Bdellovibrionales bacterium]
MQPTIENARSLLKQERFSEAIDIYNTLINQDNWNYNVLCELGNAYYLGGHPKNAIGCFYMATHIMITIKLHQEGKSQAPTSELERKKLAMIGDRMVLHLGMTIVSLHENFQQAMKAFSTNPLEEVRRYREGLLGRGPGMENQLFLEKTFNIGGNFLHQGIVWDLIGTTDVQSCQTWAYIYNRIGFLEAA